MSSAEYLRRQAATCLRVARVCSDAAVARRLLSMAEEYKMKATEMDGGSPSIRPYATKRGKAPDGETSQD